MWGGNGNHFRPYSVLRGGIAIHNPNADPTVGGGALGTLGFIATSDGSDRWLVSCYHVLCRRNGRMEDSVQEPVFHPLSQIAPTPIAMASTERANKDLDCAAARILSARIRNEILGIGKLGDPIDPVIGMRVLKAGAQTGVTEGRIANVSSAGIEIGAPEADMEFTNDYELSEGGDSGAVWVDATTLQPVGLHYRGNDYGLPERAYAQPIKPVLEALGLRLL